MTDYERWVENQLNDVVVKQDQGRKKEMTDYERWVAHQLNDVVAEQEHDKVYRQCAIDEAIAHVNHKNMSDTHINNLRRKTLADIDLELLKRH